MDERRDRRRWTLDAAVTFLHDLQAMLLRDGIPFYVGLTGSVLYGSTRSSSKDLDIICYPTSTQKSDLHALKEALQAFGLRLLYDRDIVTARWRRLGSDDTKHIEVWALGPKRVDIFFLQ